MIGLVQGGIQALSRSYFAILIPKEKSGQFFGFYNLFGKFSAIMGPALMGWIGYVTDSSRIGMLSILFFFIFGGLILFFVEEKKAATSTT